jgi:mono/diheme cytochrome c family protein/glucose/arabinose dehydrogenase
MCAQESFEDWKERFFLLEQGAGYPLHGTAAVGDCSARMRPPCLVTPPRWWSTCLAARCAVFLTAGLAQAQNGDVADEEQPALPAGIVIPAAPALTPEGEARIFVLPPGLEIELVASEPLVHDPIAAVFDEEARLWVVEMRGFMPDVDGRGEREPRGSIAVLSDRDGDGRMDERRTFLGGLVLPRAVAPTRGGALVIAPPDVLFCRDGDGDGVADEIELVDRIGTGALDSPEHAINGLCFGPEGGFRCANATVIYRHDGKQWTRVRTAGGGQWGITRDDLGRFFFDTNSDPLRGDLYPSYYAPRNQNLGTAWGANVRIAEDLRTWPARVTPGVNRAYRKETLREDFTLASVTAACAPLVYRGDALASEWRGNAFVCEPAGNLVKRYLVEEAADGTISARNAWEGREFLTSTDERFRPVNLCDGPDGALYVVDMYRGILQHRVFLTTFLRKQILSRGLDRPIGLGRIWRIRPSDWQRVAPAPLSQATWTELVRLLSHPNGWWRDTAQRVLTDEGRDERDAIELLREHAHASASPLGRMHALWTLAAVDGLDRATLDGALLDSDAIVQIAAVRASEPWIATGDEALTKSLEELGRSSDRRLARQVLLSLGEARTPIADLALASLLETACASAEDRSLALSGLGGRELEFLARLLASESWGVPREGGAELVQMLARCVAVENSSARIERLIELAAACPPARSWQTDALLAGILAGRGTDPQGKPARIRLAREPAALASLLARDAPGIAARANELSDALVWPGRPGVEAELVVRALDEAEQARFELGRFHYLAVCAACHQPSGRGEPGKAPALRASEWVLGSGERLASLVLRGLEGPLVMEGEQWSMEMPAFGETDEIVASVLTYVRREWGHGAEPVDAALVARAREAARARPRPWTVEELRAAYE